MQKNPLQQLEEDRREAMARSAVSPFGAPDALSPDATADVMQLNTIPQYVASPFASPDSAAAAYKAWVDVQALRTTDGIAGWMQDAPSNAYLIGDEIPAAIDYEEMVNRARRAETGVFSAGGAGVVNMIKNVPPALTVATTTVKSESMIADIRTLTALAAALSTDPEGINMYALSHQSGMSAHSLAAFADAPIEERMALIETMSVEAMKLRETREAAGRLIASYQADTGMKWDPYTTVFTDIRSITDFYEWSVTTGTSGLATIIISSASAMGASLVAGPVAGVVAGATVAGVLEGSGMISDFVSEYGAGAMETSDVRRIALMATISGASEVALGGTARFVTRPLMKTAYSGVTRGVLAKTSKGYVRRIGMGFAKSGAEEFSQEFLQFYLAEYGSKGEDFRFDNESLLGAFNSGMAGLLSGGVFGGGMSVRGSVAIEKLAQSAANAGFTVQTMEELIEVTRDLKLSERSPTAMKSLMTKLGLDNMSIFYQASALDEHIQETGQDLDSALATLGISRADFDAAIASKSRVVASAVGVVNLGLTEVNAPFLAENAALTSQAMTSAEVSNELLTDRDDLIAQLKAEDKATLGVTESEVYQKLKTDLLATGHRTENEAHHEASLMVSFFESMAKVYGGEVTAEQLFRKYGLTVQAAADATELSETDEVEIYEQSQAFNLDQTDEAPVLSEEAQAASEAGELLPEPSHYLYSTTDSQRLPIDVIKPTRRRTDGVANAKPLMAKAALSGARRAPIAVTPNGDGTYDVLDGNSTYALLEEAGATEVIVREMTREEFKVENEIETLRKVFKDPLKKKRRINAQAMPQDTYEDGWKLLRGKQPFAAIEEMVDTVDAQADQDELNGVLAEIADAIGIPYAPAPTKKMGRASLKATTRYDGDHRMLSDTVRGGMTLGNVSDYNTLLKMLSDKYTIIDEGFNATPVGYMDAKIPVLLPSGRWAEVQVWPPHMKEASRGGGHDAYIVWKDQEHIYTDAQRDAAMNYMLDIYSAAIAQLDLSWVPYVAPTLAKNSRLAERLASTLILKASSDMLSSTTPSSRNISRGSTDQDPAPSNAVADPSSSMRISPTSRASKNVGITSPLDEDVSQSDADVKIFYQSAAVLQEFPLQVEGTGKNGRLTKRDVANAMTERHLEAHGRVLDPINNLEDRSIVMTEMMTEYVDQLSQHDTGDGWYTADIAQAIAVTKKFLPELNDPVKRDTFVVLTALLSVKERPVPNWEKAVDAFEQYISDGAMPLQKQNGKQYGVQNVGRSLQLFQYLIDQHGEQGAIEWLTSMHSGGEIADMRRDSGLFVKGKLRSYYTPNGVTLGSEDLGIAMFGPKVSEFFLNASGVDQNAVTIDRWLTQTYNRHIGRLLEVGAAAAAKGEITSQPRNLTERSTIKEIIRELAVVADVDPSTMQAALWYFEQRLERSHGLYAISQNFKQAASIAAEKRGVAAEAELRTSTTDEVVRTLQQGAAGVTGDDQGPAGPTGSGQLTAADLDAAINDPAVLDDFLARDGWAVVTGMQESQDEAANLAANAEMLQILTDANIETAINTGMYKGEAQGDSFMILASEEEALALGALFNQESILTNKGLVYIDQTVDTTPATGENLTGEAALEEDFFSAFDNGMAFSMGLKFDQRGGDGPQGQIAFPAGGMGTGDAVITLFENANPSTFLHEAGHMFLEVYRNMAADPAVPEVFLQDYGVINEWLGRDAHDTTAFTTVQHEQWARGFEAYAMTGEAPSIKLRRAFSQFKMWLERLYSNVTDLRVNMTPEIVDVMDRMLATSEEIQLAKAEQMMGPLLLNKPAGMDDASYNRYRRLVVEHDDEAEQRVLKPMMAKLRRERSKIYNDERDALIITLTEELEATPAHQLVLSLTGDARLNRTELVARFGEGIVEDLNRKTLGTRRDAYAKGGTDIDLLAEANGFEDVVAMVNILQDYRPIKQEAINRADLRLNIKYGDVLTDGSIRRIAETALHNRKKEQVLQAEADEIRRQIEEGGGTPPPRMSMAYLRAFAHDTAMSSSVKLMENPEVFLRAERKAANEAMREFSKTGDVDALARAHFAKRVQTMNHLNYIEAKKVVKVVDQMQKKAKMLHKRKGPRKNISSPFIGEIDALFVQYDFRKLGPKEDARVQGLAKLIELLRQGGRSAEEAIDPRIVAKLDKTRYTTLTVDELMGLQNTIKNLEHMGRAEMTALRGTQKENYVTARAIFTSALHLNLNDAEFGFSKTKAEKKRTWGHKVLNTFLNSDAIINKLDGSPRTIGPVWELLKAPINSGMSSATKRQMEAHGDLAAIYDKYYSGTERTALNTKKIAVPELGFSLTLGELLSMALNTGNALNWQRLTNMDVKKGGAMSEQQVTAALNNHLTERDWHFVQDTWDFLDSFWPEISKRERELTGVVPTKVEAKPFMTPYGFVKGGYYPIKYDPRFSATIGEADTALKLENFRMGRMAKAQTKHGHIEARQTTVDRRLIFDLHVAMSHVHDVIYDLEMREPLESAWRLLNDDTVTAVFEQKGGVEVSDALKLWVQDTANGNRQMADGVNSIFLHMRHGLSVAKMGFSLTTLVQQPLGLLSAGVVVGKPQLTKAYIKYMSSPSKYSEAVKAMSDMMDERQRSFDRDMALIAEAMNEDELFGGKASQARRSLTTMAFWAIQKSQFYMVDVPTWMAAYETEMGKGTEKNKAALIADQMVERSQGSGLVSSRSAYERGTISATSRNNQMAILSTAFGTYMMNRLSLTAIRAGQTNFKNPIELMSFMVDMLMMYGLETYLSILLTGRMPDWDAEENEDKDPWIEMAKETAYSLMSGLPIVRDVSSVLKGFGGGGTSAAPIEDVVGGLVATADIAWAALQGEDADLNLQYQVKAILGGAGVLLKLPTIQLERLIDGVFMPRVSTPQFNDDITVRDIALGRRGD